MNIRVLAFAAIAMGALVLAVAAALPWIAEYSYAGVLRRYGVEDMAMAGSMAQEVLASRWSGILVSVLLGATSVVAGIFLLQHRIVGARLWLGVCVAFVIFSIVDFARVGLSAAGVLRLLIWSAALLVSVPVLRKHGPAWFSRRA